MYIVRFCEIIDDEFIEQIEENGRCIDYMKAKEMRKKLDDIFRKYEHLYFGTFYHLIYDDIRKRYF